MGALLMEDRFGSFQFTLTPTAVGANTTAEQTFKVTGLKLGDLVSVVKPSLNAGLGISTARVSANDTLAITFINVTGSPITPTSETYSFFVYRAERPVANVVKF